MRHNLEIPAASTPWTGRDDVTLAGLAESERQKDLLDIAFVTAQQRGPPGVPTKELIKNLWANPSQGVQRSPWGMRVHTMLQNSEVYSFEADCVLSGLSHLRLLGFPSNCCPVGCQTEHALRLLAGEAFTVPCASVALISTFLCPYAPWWPSSSSSARVEHHHK